ncbi:MAG: hypothetical protein PVI26_05280, partial [Chitinispirillia bacterium]
GFYILLLSGCLTSSCIYGNAAQKKRKPEWGYDFDTKEGLEELEFRLKKNKLRQKLVFSHKSLVHPREKSTSNKTERSGYGYCMEEYRAKKVRGILKKHNVIAHYSGHCHINSRNKKNKIEYISTSSLENFPGEVRHVSVFKNEIIHRIISIPGGKKLPIRWPGLKDPNHHTVNSYYMGNKEERNFSIKI